MTPASFFAKPEATVRPPESAACEAAGAPPIFASGAEMHSGHGDAWANWHKHYTRCTATSRADDAHSMYPPIEHQAMVSFAGVRIFRAMRLLVLFNQPQCVASSLVVHKGQLVKAALCAMHMRSMSTKRKF